MTTPTRPTPSMRTSGAVSGVLASLALGVTAFAPTWVGAVVFVALAAGLAWGWPRLIDLPSPRGTSAVIALTAVALAVTMVASGDTERTRWGGAVLCVGLIGSFLHQLLRQDGRPRLVMSLAGTALALGVLGAGSYVIPALDDAESAHLVLAVALATGVGSAIDGAAGATQRRLELGIGQVVLGALVGSIAVVAGARFGSAALAGACAGLVSWACLRTTVTLATSAHRRAQIAAGCACVLVCGIVPVAVARIM